MTGSSGKNAKTRTEPMAKKVMRLLDSRTGLMECKICGAVHYANLRHGGGYVYGSWQCVHGCKLTELQPAEGKGMATIDPHT